MGTVFISYRREDTSDVAKRLFDEIQQEPSAEVFLDEGGELLPGEDFVERLGKEIATVDVVLLLIGSKWLEARFGRRARVFDKQDVLRREIEYALKREREIVPVLVDGATMPDATDLPESIRLLSRRQALRLSRTSWDKDVGRLVGRLESLFEQADKAAFDLLEAMDKGGIQVGSVYPWAAGERFRDMPIIGKWRIDIKSQGFHPALPDGHTALTVTLREDDTFIGEILKGRLRLGGRWSLGLWSGGLMIKLDAVINGAQEFQYRIPVADRSGDGYFGSMDGLSFTVHSLGGRPLRMHDL